MIVIQESKNTAQSWWDGIVAFNNDWLLGTRLKILVFGGCKLFSSVEDLSHFIATFAVHFVILLLLVLYVYHFIAHPQTSACLGRTLSPTG